jgi:rubrerythrin
MEKDKKENAMKIKKKINKKTNKSSWVCSECGAKRKHLRILKEPSYRGGSRVMFCNWCGHSEELV